MTLSLPYAGFKGTAGLKNRTGHIYYTEARKALSMRGTVIFYRKQDKIKI